MTQEEIKRRYALEVLAGDPEPFCPRCGGTNGVLGTSNAYFLCRDCDSPEASYCYYYIDGGAGPDTKLDWLWEEAVHASPWGRCVCTK